MPVVGLLAGLAGVNGLCENPSCVAWWVVYNTFLRADVAQLVEHNLAKVGVAGSNPVVRSI